MQVGARRYHFTGMQRNVWWLVLIPFALLVAAIALLGNATAVALRPYLGSQSRRSGTART